ncbi:MAG: hypothetical protein GY953_03430 [bacterium]|nr:hypothetical protein [bacterium]
MNTKVIVRIAAALVMVAALGLAQTPPAAPAEGGSTTPVAKQPQPKSQEEIQAIQGIMSALTPESRIEACEKLVTDFAKTEFKAFAMQMATASAQQLNDYERTLLYGERTLEADPKNFAVMLIMANALGQRTREFDLDKEEKLNRVEDLCQKAMAALETAPRPREDITDDQWAMAKKDFRAQAHDALGLAAMARKDWDTAIAEFKNSVEIANTPEPASHLRMAHSMNKAQRHDEAIAALDQLMADPQLHAQIRQLAQQERLNAVRGKEAAAK